MDVPEWTCTSDEKKIKVSMETDFTIEWEKLKEGYNGIMFLWK